MALKKLILGKSAKKIGVPPAIILCNPKNDYNVGGVQRAASNFGIRQVWFTGNRVQLEATDGTAIDECSFLKNSKLFLVNWNLA